MLRQQNVVEKHDTRHSGRTDVIQEKLKRMNNKGRIFDVQHAYKITWKPKHKSRQYQAQILRLRRPQDENRGTFNFAITLPGSTEIFGLVWDYPSLLGVPTRHGYTLASHWRSPTLAGRVWPSRSPLTRCSERKLLPRNTELCDQSPSRWPQKSSDSVSILH